MTKMVPITAGLVGYVAALMLGYPNAALFIGLACAGMGFLGRFAGNGLHLNGAQMREVTHLTHRAIAANWGLRPLTQRFEEHEQQKLLGSMFDAVAGEPIQELVEQWPILWAHVQRVHFSGIPPLASLRAMKRAYRARLFSKDKSRAGELAKPVAAAYAALHPSPGDDFDWFTRWASAIGLPEEVAHQIWHEAMHSEKPASVQLTPLPEVDCAAHGEGAISIEPSPPCGDVHLSDEEIDRRLAATR
ncbi:hypothetical protein [Sphingomonas sp. 3-13AW]|uniref:hypothetical protein n=1 Tax=Sphingomonas sp. 3-13AW TaxID=3050450 RepID=UPI003BB49721